jgi:hypothetical protein
MSIGDNMCSNLGSERSMRYLWRHGKDGTEMYHTLPVQVVIILYSSIKTAS